MDTPQITAAELDAAMAQLLHGDADAVLGPAEDGGWWALGLRQPCPDVFDRIPMSTPHTAAAQRQRLRDLGRRVASLPAARDIDTWQDAIHVATLAPTLRTARAVLDAQAEPAA